MLQFDGDADAVSDVASSSSDELKAPDYSRFIENLKEDENEISYSVEFSINSDISVVRYEVEEEVIFENVDRQRNFMRNSKREKAKVQESFGGFSEKIRVDKPKTTKESLEIRVEGGKKRLRDVFGQKKERDDGNKSSEKSLKLMNCVVKDEVPDFFDKSGMYTTTHHKNDRSCSEVEVLTSDNMPLFEGDYMPFVTSKCFVGEVCGDDIKGSGPSQFREKLMDLFKIPFNEQELSKLWREVTERKSTHGDKGLVHRRMKSYSTKTKGKSYLDRHEALKQKIENFRDDRVKVLYLLRGFFFWLENTPHEGAFQPWMDNMYLKGLDCAKNA